MAEQLGGRGGGARSPSMAQVAERAGVSHQTVSSVLNDASLVKEETRARVLAAIEELGYRRTLAARLLATNRSRRIGMVSAHLALHGPSMIATAVQEAGHVEGYDVSLIGLPELSAEALHGAVDRLCDEAVEAIVVAVAHREAADMTRDLRLSIPVVTVEGVSAGQPLSAGIDQELGARLATDHLLDLGHRHVAHVSGPRDWVEATQRRTGWRRAHEERGLLPGPELDGDWSPGSGYRAGLMIADDGDITAVFAGNDSMAQILGAHMLEVCPTITTQRASLEVHPLAIGGREDPVRLRFTADPGPAVVARLSDLGDRFRLTVNEVEVVEPDEALPHLPVACAVWEPRPSLSTSAEAWLMAGAPHHTVLSKAIGVEVLEDFAEMTGTEMVTIDADTTPRSFQRELRWNAAYHRLNQGL